MAQAMTLPLIGALAIAGVGAGIHLGHAAIGEINPIYYEKPETRFHADLSANPPSTTASPIMMARADDPALGSGCIGCRTYPEEYFPVHDASLDRYSSGYAADVSATPEPVITEQADPEALRIRESIQRVERYASGQEPQIVHALAQEAPVEDVQAEELPTVE